MTDRISGEPFTWQTEYTYNGETWHKCARWTDADWPERDAIVKRTKTILSEAMHVRIVRFVSTVPTPPAVPDFTGEWEYDDTLDCSITSYEAVGYDRPMSYGVSPIVTYRVLEAFALRQNMLGILQPGVPYDRILPDGNGFLVINSEDQSYSGTLAPDPDGLFHLSGLGYCFHTLTDDDNVIQTVRSNA